MVHIGLDGGPGNKKSNYGPADLYSCRIFSSLGPRLIQYKPSVMPFGELIQKAWIQWANLDGDARWLGAAMHGDEHRHPESPCIAQTDRPSEKIYLFCIKKLKIVKIMSMMPFLN